VAAIAVTQRYRSEGAVISAVSTSPKLCRTAEGGRGIPISFYLNRDDTVDLAIVEAEGREARRTLARDVQLEGNRRYCYRWDGRDDHGNRLPAGRYRLRVSLADADRVAVAGESIRLTSAGKGS
jgi:flagellar hook assembly protein FlgD